MSEAIAAIATGSQPCAIGIVRVSGDGCFTLCEHVFRPSGPQTSSVTDRPPDTHPDTGGQVSDSDTGGQVSDPDGGGQVSDSGTGRRLSAQPPRKMVLGECLDRAGRVIDHGLAVRFPGPHSYTGEDCVEFHCHGSPVVLRELLDALSVHGVRQALPGEFTRRAFLNGRMDLTQAEAVIDLIDARTAAMARNAAAQLDGGLRRILEPVQDALLDIAARFYAVVDYPDEDIEDVRPEEMINALQTSEQTLKHLLAACGRGRVLKNGVRTAIIGRPNAGKSSLLNALAGFDRAIVTDIPGTTRDTVEESAICGGVLLRLTDTAGLRQSGDAVERLGVERSRKAAEYAELIFVVTDVSSPFTAEDSDAVALARTSGVPWILIENKCDLLSLGVPPFPHSDAHKLSNTRNTSPSDDASDAAEDEKVPGNIPIRVRISAKTGEGLSTLENAVSKLYPAGQTEESGTFLTDSRQEDAARRSMDALNRAREALTSGLSPDAVLTDVEAALDALGELTGRTAKEKIVSRIFERFCVGK